ncbi:thioredoxin reductase (NADPH) [Pelagirhabdus alkalitolerans]|uniref:Ferredoxin--NADP reductase n=1 Tax=Pelagirhabdus alkalitolerans TaxID=1612202 RepID=A0A1G6GQN4_9BACI|nr:NAD(P)/FAD-dependent oxidoreductase [Pelagirhabdus alkalitolerans]SDB84352.1 thioredoxin reductase (NADPH) [Pelagirhabdus alkalitolerans]
MSVELFDVTIIGGGPAGLYSAFYSGLRNMKTKLIDAHSTLGGKMHVYPEKMIWDVGGVAPIKGQDLIRQLSDQALTFDPTVVLNEKVVSITRGENDHFILTTNSGERHWSQTVIIAVGSGILYPKRLEVEKTLNTPVKNIHYTMPQLKQFKDKRVLISGGGNSAIDWALLLEPIASEVGITFRKETPTAHERSVNELMTSSINIYSKHIVTDLVTDPKTNTVHTTTLTSIDTQDEIELSVDAVIINHGYEQDTSLLDESDLDLERKNDFYLAGTAECTTSLSGIYAAGDIISYPGKVNLIAGCFQDAVNAVNQAKKQVDPEADSFGTVSSHHAKLQNKF